MGKKKCFIFLALNIGWVYSHLLKYKQAYVYIRYFGENILQPELWSASGILNTAMILQPN